VALVLCAPLAAQQKEASASDGTFTIQSKVDEVMVPVLVRDKQGNAVGNLRKENFQIFDNDKGQAIYGKAYSMDKIGLPKPYYSFIKNGWKFIVLDSVLLDIDNTWYIGKLGDEQFTWLQTELQNTPATMPVMAVR